MDPTSLVGLTIGGIRIKERLGRGGMGDVYLAEQNLGAGTKEVALKTIRAQYMVHEDAIKRFQEEAFAAGTLKTSYVAQVMSYGQIPAQGSHPAMHYLAMEYCSAGTLHHYMNSFPDRRLPIEEGIRLLRQAAEGLLAAERRVDRNGKPDPLVHRDIKPANILLQRSGATDRVDIRISDFGAVKRQGRTEVAGAELSQQGAPMTPGYASPEQWNFEEVDHRSDMYSLGATFYHVLTGQRATPDTEQLGLIRKFVMQMPCLSLKAVLKDVPEAFNRVIEKMTMREPEDRYPSFANIVQELAVFEQKQASLKKVWFAVGIAVSLLAVLVLMFGPRSSDKASDGLVEYRTLSAQLVATREQPALQQFRDLGDELATIAERLTANTRELEALIAAEGQDATMPPGFRDKRVLLTQELAQCERRLGEATQVLVPLQALEGSFAELPKATALDRLDAIAGPASVASLRDRKKELQQRILELFAGREAELESLQASFVAGSPEPGVAEGVPGTAPAWFRQQREAVDAFARKMADPEPGLADRAKQLLAAIDGAAALEVGLPSWPLSAAPGPQEQLVALMDSLQAVASIAVPPNPAQQAWWTSRRGALARRWKPEVVRLITDAKAGYEAIVDALQNRPRPEAERALRDEVRPSHERLSQLFARVDKALRGSAVFSSEDKLEFGALLRLGAPPTLQFKVDELARGYRRFLEVADAFVAARAASGDPANKLREDANAALKKLEDLTAAKTTQIPDFPGYSLPRELDAGLALLVNGYFQNLIAGFRSGLLPAEKQLIALAGLGQAFQDWNPDCAALAGAVTNQFTWAQDLVSRVEKAARVEEPDAGAVGSGATLKAHAEAFRRAVKEIALIRNSAEPDPDRAAWRRAWSSKRSADLEVPIKDRIQKASAELQGTLRELEAMAAELEKDDERIGKEFGGVVARALQVIESGAAPVKPDDWSTDAWKCWPELVKVPPGLRARREGDVLVCWFDFRQRIVDIGTGQRLPVEMVLVKPKTGRPFLVDRHEVCVGELLALGVNRSKDPGGYLARREQHWRSINQVPTALVSWTSKQMAEQLILIRTYSERAVFSLPTPEQWSAMVAGAAPLPRGEVGRPAEVCIDPTDSVGGVYDLRSGLAEWLSNGVFRGESDYQRDDLKSSEGSGQTWIKGVGFRCVLTL